MASPGRDAVLAAIADLALARARPDALPGVTRVAIDGVDGAGKTVFADELAAVLTARGRPVIRAGVDGFHRPRAARYRLGRTSPEGYYRASYDYEALARRLLDPLAPGGTGRYRRAAFDHRADQPVDMPAERAPEGAILVFDGIFLHRPELRGHWDMSVFLDVPFAVSIPRMAARDGSSPDPAAPEHRRYVEGQRLYLAECDPRAQADVVVDHTELARPVLVRPVSAPPPP